MKHKRQITIHYLLDKLKHGCDILSLYEGSSPSQFHQVVAVIVGVGMGVAGLYIAGQKGCLEWLNIPGEFGQKGSSEFIYYIPGLQNLGNNCFLNVIIQALASCSSFYPFLQNIMIDDDLLLDQKAEKMPLRVALTSLLEDLCVVRDERTVLNPRKVMLAMGNYVSSFNLTRQQDASEAFLHLLSSLEEEVSQYYVPQDSSLAEIASSSSRIYQPVREGQSDSARWQKDYIGPLVGTISSVLACRGCSSVLSMDVESFHCLPLTPLQAKMADLVDGCTLVDCIKHFIAAEHLENYRCSQCWHNAALKYLSSKSQKDEKKIETISNCVELDSCDCKSLFLQGEVRWPGFSDAVKRLRIARCPKILCIHLQRASMSPHGDPIKLQGHISFPLVLDMFPFTEAAAKVKQEILFANMGNQGMNPQHFSPIHSVLQWKVQTLPHIYKISTESIASEPSLRNKTRNFVCDSLEDCSPSTAKGCSRSDAILEDKAASGYGYHISQAHSMFQPEFNKPNIGDGSPDTSKKILYRLSSIVEHYGRPESGHYAVYRRLSSETSMRQWLYISDDKVSSVSEEAALAAEASMLFYERIEEPL